jgi:5-methylcytosine-specific restriction enzyme subunit McrC
MMAYARVYRCERLMLLYPALPGVESGITRRFGIHGGTEMLAVGRADVAGQTKKMGADLKKLIRDLMVVPPVAEKLLKL